VPINLSIFDKAIKSLQEEEVIGFTSLSGSSGALFFSMVRGSCLLICHSEDTAREFYSDALFWSESLDTEEPVLIPPKGDPLRFKNLRAVYPVRKKATSESFNGVNNQGKTKFIASAEAALSPLWQRDKFPLLSLVRGSTSNRDFVIETLKNYGYLSVPLVSGAGELSIRGGILDVFPPEEEFPVRMEFFGDEIESLRYFDTDTQRTIEELKEISIGPAVEPEEGPNLINILSETMVILNEPDDIKRHYPELPEILKGRKTIYFTSLPLKGEDINFGIKGIGGMGILPEERKNIEDFVKRVKELRKRYFILIICSSGGQAKRLKELFIEGDLEVPILKNNIAFKYADSPVITTGEERKDILRSEVSRGFICQDSIVLSGRDIFGEKLAFRPIKKSRVSRLISSIDDFKEGDYLVHTEHGIGRFMGVKKQRIEDYEGDFIIIEYLEGSRLYVPLERINYVQKYHAPEDVKPRIDKLGGKTWQRTQQRVRQKIMDMAERLLSLYARRSAVPGYAFSGDTELHREFDDFFLYEETPDQLTSTNEIKYEMETPTPMERLLCGDTGYGKTEVIMRACFKAVYDSKQVAVLVPTTILAEQHYNTFTSRFSAFPIRIDFLSRFKSRAEQKQTLRALAEGEIDIIIGTHRLLARDVNFYNLGLLVIDEEHKFGVAHKEKIKSLKTNVDVLTLSATPIPRTLHMALSGIRAMSVIETPPEDRLAVRSFVARFNPQIIKDALQKELDRGGQAFFVHNRIQDIYSIATFLRELLPEARIAVAHGQMREKELEQVMRLFFKNEVDILVSTAIVGSGLDIPSANTIIINRADKFGLADLYQLRGRVGRSNIRAYAYFLIPGEDIITEGARKKLQAIQELSYLGAGFRLALKDLEIRGAGNLLGPEQSGHIEAVGFDLYVEMLEQAVAELKVRDSTLRGEKIVPKIEPFLDLKITAIIPESYIENPDLRLSLYRKIASAKDRKSLADLLEELKDRFGASPEETLRLLEVMELKLLAKKLAVTRIQNAGGRIKILFAPQTPVTPEKIFSLYPVRKKVSNGVYKNREKYFKFLPEGGIEIDLRDKSWNEIFRELKEIMEELN
jgi:transcription-repair coupling factor (superfamily II helicase)